MKPDKIYTGRSTIRMYNCDCMDMMKTGNWDLAIVDPPYFDGPAMNGFYHGGNSQKKTDYKTIEKWDTLSEGEYDRLARVTEHQIIWGCNYYPYLHLPVGRIVWDKLNRNSSFSDCEIASFSGINSVKYFSFVWDGFRQGNMKNKQKRIHPTEKPIALYKWLLTNYANEGDTILDTHGGSMSIAIACWDLGFDLDICELDTDYFNDAVKRFENHIAQKQMVFQ